VPINDITRKLDNNFFAGRWARATDRQRQLLAIVASLENCEEEFTVQEVAARSRKLAKPFSPSHISQMLAKLGDAGLVYKTDVQAAAGKVDGIFFPEAGGAINSYPIARLKDAPNPTGAQAFIDLVLSATGRSVLAQAGFLSATP